MISPTIGFNGETQVELNDMTIDSLDDQLALQARSTDPLAPLPVALYGALDVDLTSTPFLTTGAIFPIPHGLGYTPMFLVFEFDSVSQRYTPLPVVSTTGAGAPGPSLPFDTAQFAYADPVNLNIMWQGHAQAKQQHFYYYIFANPINQL